MTRYGIEMVTGGLGVVLGLYLLIRYTLLKRSGAVTSKHWWWPIAGLVALLLGIRRFLVGLERMG